MTADTTAMNTPHEVKYTLTFDKASIQSETSQTTIIVGIAVVFVVAVIIVFVIRKKKGISNET